MTLNAISGRRAPTSTAPADGVEPLRAEVRLQLARVDPALELVRAAAPEERRPASRCELAVEEDGQPELVADRGGRAVVAVSCARGMSSGTIGTSGTTSAAPIRGMRSLVAAQVDPVARARDSGEERVDELVIFADEGEDRPVVVGVGVDVEQLGRARRARRAGRRASPARVPRRSSAPIRAAAPRAYSRSVKAYYEARAREYDDWVYGTGLFAERDRPAGTRSANGLGDAVAAMPPARTLDIACGTGWLTQHLRGEIVGLDASPSMLEVAAERIPEARVRRR